MLALGRHPPRSLPAELPGGDARRPFPGPSARESRHPPAWPWLPQPRHPGPANPTPARSGHLPSLTPRPAQACPAAPHAPPPSAPEFPSPASHFPHSHPGAPLAECPESKRLLALLPPTSLTRQPPQGTPSARGRTVCPRGRQGFCRSSLAVPPAAPPRHIGCPQARPPAPGWPASLGPPRDCPPSAALPSECCRAGQGVPTALPAGSGCLLSLVSCSGVGGAATLGLGVALLPPQRPAWEGRSLGPLLPGVRPPGPVPSQPWVVHQVDAGRARPRQALASLSPGPQGPAVCRGREVGARVLLPGELSGAREP